MQQRCAGRGSVWFNNAGGTNDDHVNKFDQCGHHEKKAGPLFAGPAPTITSEPSSTPTSKPPTSNSGVNRDADALALHQKTQLLERELHHRDAIIAQLRTTMEAVEKVHVARIELLERQIEVLVESSSEECERYHDHDRSAALPSVERNEHQKSSKSETTTNTNNEGHHRHRIEVSALRELLARVIAEKDRLASENRNLRSLLVMKGRVEEESQCQSPTTSISSSSKASSSVVEGCSASIHNECETRGACCYPVSDNGEYIPEDENVEMKKSLPPTTGQHNSVVFKMSCRACPKNHSHIEYVGSYILNASTRRRPLIKMTRMYFAQVWKMVQEYREDENDGSILSSPHGEELHKRGPSGGSDDFPSSSMARHLVKHCMSFSSKGEVLVWCMENVKVEIVKNRG